jgi:hypothetical protein
VEQTKRTQTKHLLHFNFTETPITKQQQWTDAPRGRLLLLVYAWGWLPCTDEGRPMYNFKTKKQMNNLSPREMSRMKFERMVDNGTYEVKELIERQDNATLFKVWNTGARTQSFLFVLANDSSAARQRVEVMKDLKAANMRLLEIQFAYKKGWSEYLGEPIMTQIIKCKRLIIELTTLHNLILSDDSFVTSGKYFGVTYYARTNYASNETRFIVWDTERLCYVTENKLESHSAILKSSYKALDRWNEIQLEEADKA